MLNKIIEFDDDWFTISISCKEIFRSLISKLQLGSTFVPIRLTFFFELFISGLLKIKFIELQDKIQKSEPTILTTLYLSTSVSLKTKNCKNRRSREILVKTSAKFKKMGQIYKFTHKSRTLREFFEALYVGPDRSITLKKVGFSRIDSPPGAVVISF